jgi:AcrR family transcriptional regulator
VDGFELIKERKRESICRAAAELFRSYGIDKTSIGDIARKAGVSPATIYNHFGGKNNLVHEIIKRLVREQLEKGRKIIESKKTFSEKLKDILVIKIEIVNRYDRELIKQVVNKDPVISEFFTDIYEKESKRLFFKLIEEGKEQGYINPEISMDALFTYLEILRNGTEGYAALLNASNGDNKMIEDLWDIFFYGILNRNPKDKKS